MIKARRWTYLLLGVLGVFIAVNAVVWKLYTGELLEFSRFYNGGLDRMAYVSGSKHYRTPGSTLPRHVIENADFRGGPVDVVTVGDSFLNVRDNGPDPLVQDWIASLSGLEVLNVQRLPRTTLFETITVLANSGWLDRVRPRAVVLETVERDCVLEYARPVDLSLTRPMAEVEEHLRTARYRYNWPEVGFINTGNFKFLYYNVLRRWSDRAFFLDVVVRELDRPFFSVRNDRLLLFYADDIGRIGVSTEASVGMMNDHLNRLADLLARKGIRLYFMPAADKYDMYSGYIVDNPYRASVFFELLRPMSRRYTLVDTKAILAGEIARGEKDIYYADDTHWSWKAVKKIAESIRFPPRGARLTAERSEEGR